jgi:hypothetical protein
MASMELSGLPGAGGGWELSELLALFLFSGSWLIFSGS